MKQYQPYGKAGAGAPIYKDEHKRHKFTEYHTQSGVTADVKSDDRAEVHC